MKSLVIGRGSVFADLLIIGEAPGEQEDLEGKPYVGKSGKLLNELLIQAGSDYKKDVYFCNVITKVDVFFLLLIYQQMSYFVLSFPFSERNESEWPSAAGSIKRLSVNVEKRLNTREIDTRYGLRDTRKTVRYYLETE